MMTEEIKRMVRRADFSWVIQVKRLDSREEEDWDTETLDCRKICFPLYWVSWDHGGAVTIYLSTT